jgi:hypothetical protein
MMYQPHDPTRDPHAYHEYAKAVRAVAEHFAGIIAEADSEYRGREQGKEESSGEMREFESEDHDFFPMAM